MRTRSLLVGIAMVAAACGKAAAPPPAPAAGSGSAAAPSQGVAIVVDDQPAATVTPAQLATWPRLDTLVPVSARRIGQWDDVVVAGSQPTTMHRISDQHPDLVPALFPSNGGASFGLFDPVELGKRGMPQIRSDGVRELRIKLAQNSGRGEHESGQGGGADPSQLSIDIKTPAGASKLAGKTLLAIPRQPLPGETGEGRGWPLQLLLDAAGIKKFAKLVLTDSEGLTVELEQADFDAKTSMPYVKLNRQGALRFTLFKKQGEGWQKRGDLRGLASIEVVK
ncbi:MAG TPA: hypothetical protein VGF94_30150 [Kofleriaceae bacterium]|jgi:hypothetical protein